MLTRLAAVLADQSVARRRIPGSSSSSISCAASLPCCPAPILWGASFPLALASVAARGEDPARLVGGVYAANTLGAIVGSLGASLLLVVWLGTQRAQQLMIVLAAFSALVLTWRETARHAVAGRRRGAGRAHRTEVHPVPGILIAYGRYVPSQLGQSEVIYSGEGWNASVAVSASDRMAC